MTSIVLFWMYIQRHKTVLGQKSVALTEIKFMSHILTKNRVDIQNGLANLFNQNGTRPLDAVPNKLVCSNSNKCILFTA